MGAVISGLVVAAIMLWTAFHHQLSDFCFERTGEMSCAHWDYLSITVFSGTWFIIGCLIWLAASYFFRKKS